MSEGWRCPGCQRCWSPTVECCKTCGPAARCHVMDRGERCLGIEGHPGKHECGLDVGDSCKHGVAYPAACDACQPPPTEPLVCEHGTAARAICRHCTRDVIDKMRREQQAK